QTVMVGIVILIPLIFGERLPKMPVWMTIAPPLRSQPEPAPVKNASTSASSQSILHSTPRVYTMPIANSHATMSAGPVILNDADTGAISMNFGQSGVIGGVDTGRPLFSAVAPPKPAVKPVDNTP